MESMVYNLSQIPWRICDKPVMETKIMVINVKNIRNSIEIKCKPLIPSKFKYSLLELLREHYILTTESGEIIDDIKPDRLTLSDKMEYTSAYNEAGFGCTFEEFLELVCFPIGSVILLSKENKEKLAYVDFEPDGDVNMIWIELFSSEIKNDLLLLIDLLI